MTPAASHIQVTNAPTLKVMLILEYHCNMEIIFSISSLTDALLFVLTLKHAFSVKLLSIGFVERAIQIK